MPSFRNAKAQAEHAVSQKLGIGKARHTNKGDHKIHSLGTARNYAQALTRLTHWIQENRLGDLKNLTSEVARQYLEAEGQRIRQKALDQARQAIQLQLGITLPVIKSELTQARKSRAYTLEQIAAIVAAQTSKNSLSTKIAATAGLRAHELFTLRRIEERSASGHRQWSTDRLIGREGKRYTVIGKGGLIREVLIPHDLAEQLESKRLTLPAITEDRNIRYTQYYDISGGKNWSNSFSAASKRTLKWSHGAHGVRHTFAQTRMEELQQRGFRYEAALGIVSQQMGHFRPSITEVYLL